MGRMPCLVANSFAARSSAVEPIVDPSKSIFLMKLIRVKGIERDVVLKCMMRYRHRNIRNQKSEI